MTFSTFFGLPAHPLFVHVPVVLIPLVSLGAIAMACSARVRAQFGWLVLALGIVAGLSTQLAIETGQALRHSVPQSAALRRHVQIAESIRPLILVVFLIAAAVMLTDRFAKGAWPFRGRTGTAPGVAVRAVLIGLTVVFVLGANVRLYQIGESGARATWQRVHVGKPANAQP